MSPDLSIPGHKKFFLPFVSLGNSFPKRQNLDSSKLQDSEDNNFKFNENGRRLSKRIENIAGKGERATSSFPAVFQKNLYCRQVKTRACLRGLL